VDADPQAPPAVTPAPTPAPIPPPAAALTVEGLSKNYEGQLAVSDLSFRVATSEILGLVGPNGAGKTTTLRSIVGVLPLQAGRVTIWPVGRRSPRAKPTRPCVRRGWHGASSRVRDDLRRGPGAIWAGRQAEPGLIPDDPQPLDSLTAGALAFQRGAVGVADWEARAERLLERFELTEKRGALGGELSRGMRQKLAFCCAWLHKPGVVLMDEPLSGLDPRGIRSAKLAIRELAREGTAVILSSHLLELIEELAHRILIVDHGRKVFAGTLVEARASLRVKDGSSLEEIFMAATSGPASPASGDLAAGAEREQR
jgi:ABC-2 type transport system ATP-binding protein